MPRRRWSIVLAGLTMLLATEAQAEQSAAQLREQQTALTSTLERMHQESRGSLAQYSGIYDLQKSCSADLDRSLDDLRLPLDPNVSRLLTMRAIWFVDDRMYVAGLLAPKNVSHVQVVFDRKWQGSPRSFDLVKKQLDNGEEELIGLADDRFIFEPKFSGKRVTYQYFARCENEREIAKWAHTVFDREIAKAGGAPATKKAEVSPRPSTSKPARAQQRPRRSADTSAVGPDQFDDCFFAQLYEAHAAVIDGCSAILDAVEEAGPDDKVRQRTFERIESRFTQTLGSEDRAFYDEIRPEAYYRIYFDRGNASLEIGNYDNAMADFKQVIERDSGYAPAYVGRGRTYLGMKDYSHSLADFNKALKLAPEYSFAYFHRSRFYSTQEKYSEAISDLNKAIQINPKYANAYGRRGSVYFALEKYDKALSDYDKAIELDPLSAQNHVDRGDVYFTMDDEHLEQALSDYSKAIELDPSNADAYDQRGFVYTLLDEYARAMKDYNKLVELDPRSPYVYVQRGDAYLNMDEKHLDEAIADYTKAIRLDPQRLSAYEGRSEAYELKHDMVHAAADKEKAEALREALQ